MLLRIKEFADFCNVSVRALHLYDRMSLFQPAEIDKNGYRYYDTKQMSELNTIVYFKSIGFSLKDIKEMKSKNYAPKDLILQLHRKQKENLNQIEILSHENDNIELMLDSLSASNSKEEKQELSLISKIILLENEIPDQNFSKIIWL